MPRKTKSRLDVPGNLHQFQTTLLILFFIILASTKKVEHLSNRTEKITDALGTVTQFDYDAYGNLVRLTQAKGKPEETITTYTYNNYNQLISANTGGSTILSYIILTKQKESLYQHTVKTGKTSLNYFVNIEFGGSFLDGFQFAFNGALVPNCRIFVMEPSAFEIFNTSFRPEPDTEGSLHDKQWI